MRVLKDITTPTSHFPAGAEVNPEDITGPLTVEAWQELGHLEKPKAQKPREPAAPAPTPTSES